MFSTESINKVIRLAHESRTTLDTKSVDDIKLCISAGNRKIGKVMNVSLMPIVTCSNCAECMYYCYDVKACLQYSKTVIDARMRNTVILQKNRAEYFRRIDSAISRRKVNKFFRWHVAGDIVDYDYFENMVAIARKHSDFTFWTYTKNYNMVNCWLAYNGKLPQNLIVMFSEWDGVELNNPYNMPTFSCKLKAGNKNHPAEYFETLYKCPGNCDICKACKRGCIAGENTYADEH